MRVTKTVVVVDEGRHKFGMGNEESRGYMLVGTLTRVATPFAQ